MEKGKLIVIEGTDGVGKSTQVKLLTERLKTEGEVITHHFPTYDTPEGQLAANYLKGVYGEIKNLSPEGIWMLYAVDREITWLNYLKKEYEAGKTILLDRYTTSSLMYQGASIDDLEERKKLVNFIQDFEYNKVGIQKPDLVLFLHADLGLTNRLREERERLTNTKPDLHESNKEYMERVYKNAMFLSNYLNWTSIKCDNEDSTNLRSIEDIHEEIYRLVKKMDK